MHPKAIRRLPAAILAAVFVMSGRSAARAFSDGPPDGFCGNPPAMNNCTLCHLDYPLNSGNGSLELLNAPDAFVPGQLYDLVVRLADPGQNRWGFQLTVLGPGNQQAGLLTVTDAVRTQLSDNPGTMPDFLMHTAPGTQEGTPNGPVTWSFQWTAPDVTSVTFYVAGNAADGTFDPGQDYIYTTALSIDQGIVAVEERTWGTIKSLYRRR